MQRRLALAKPLSKLGGAEVSVSTRRALNSGGVTQRAVVAHRLALGITPLGAPHHAQLHFARLGRSIGLFARSARKVFGPHGDPCAIDSQIHRWGARLPQRLYVFAFVAVDGFPQRLGAPFDLLAADIEAGQATQQRIAFFETHHRPNHPHHPQHPGGQ
jgi:hypothetical protein